MCEFRQIQVECQPPPPPRRRPMATDGGRALSTLSGYRSAPGPLVSVWGNQRHAGWSFRSPLVRGGHAGRPCMLVALSTFNVALDGETLRPHAHARAHTQNTITAGLSPGGSARCTHTRLPSPLEHPGLHRTDGPPLGPLPLRSRSVDARLRSLYLGEWAPRGQ